MKDYKVRLMDIENFDEFVLRINVREKTASKEQVPETWKSLGGRGLIARILLDEVPATCDPLGSFNKLIFAPGLLVGHRLSSFDRISIGAKSPLTKGVKESNAGGTTGYQIVQLRIKSLIIEDQPVDSGFSILYLSEDTIRFDSGNELIGKGVYESAKILTQHYGNKVAIALIGPGGEMKLRAAGICNLDKDLVPSRISARGGLGAVMGSKGLKAIIFDSEGCQKPPLANSEKFRETQQLYTRALLAHPQTKVYKEYGTSANVRMVNAFGALPTRNFSSGEFEGVEKISGEELRKNLITRGGECKTSHACMPGCVILSSNVYGDEHGQKIVSPMEYESIGLLGPNLGIENLDDIANMNQIINDIGLDTIDIGAALGVAARAGVLKFGDGKKAIQLLEEIRTGTPLGRVLGNGAAITGQVFAIQQVPVVKGQAMSAYDPRAIKGTGVTYATSPQGADHTCGLTLRAKIDHLKPEGQVEVSKTVQINMAGYDTIGACIFTVFCLSTIPFAIKDFLNAKYGWEVGEDILQTLGRETLELELEFNKLAGFTKADDRLPEYMTLEPIAPHNTVFDVPGGEMDEIFKW